MTGCTKPRRGAGAGFWVFGLVLGWLLLLAGGAAAQEVTASLPDEIVARLSPEHVRLPGSTFYVRPAQGYVTEELLNGLAKPKGGLLEVLRVPEANFLNIRQLIVQQYLTERGGRVAAQRELIFNGYPAVFGEGESLEPGKNLMLLAFGDTTAIVVVFGLYPATDAKAAGELRQMLLTGWYDPRGQVPPLEQAPFVIGLARSGFQLHDVVAEDKLYRFGLGPTAAADTFATRFTVQALPTTSLADSKLRLLDQLVELAPPGVAPKSQERKLPYPDGYAYEISGSTTVRGRRASYYQLIRTDSDGTLLFHGVAFGPPPAKAAPKPTAKGKTAPKSKPVADPTGPLRKVAATMRMKR